VARSLWKKRDGLKLNCMGQGCIHSQLPPIQSNKHIFARYFAPHLMAALKLDSDSKGDPRTDDDMCWAYDNADGRVMSPTNGFMSLTRAALPDILSDLMLKTFCEEPQVKVPIDSKTPLSTRVFQCKTLPGISLRDYLERMLKYTEISAEAAIIAIMWVYRIREIDKEFSITSFTLHRLILAALQVAAKFHDDKFFANHWYARIGGVDTKEMNALEIEFLFLINFDMFITTQEYNAFYSNLAHVSLSITKHPSSSSPPPISTQQSVPSPIPTQTTI
jgi:hypothetical protein